MERTHYKKIQMENGSIINLFKLTLSWFEDLAYCFRLWLFENSVQKEKELQIIKNAVQVVQMVLK
jgi:hypothetical protein